MMGTPNGDGTKISLDMSTPNTPSASRPKTSSVTAQSTATATSSLREQEKLFDDMKKENFDLKLRLYQLDEKLNRLSSTNLEACVKENCELKAKLDVVQSEVEGYKLLVEDARQAVHELQQGAQSRSVVEAEISRLRQEVEGLNQQLVKSQQLSQRYEGQLALADRETREAWQRLKQLEMDNQTLQKRLQETQQQLEVREGETATLEEEVARKVELIHQFKMDLHHANTEMELLSRQTIELQNQVRLGQEERDEISRQLQQLQQSTGPNLAVTQSPRSSMDLIESKLLREMGQAMKKFQSLERETEQSAQERGQLVSQAQYLAQELQQGVQGVASLIDRICLNAGVEQRSLPADVNLAGVLVELEDVCAAVIEDYETVKRDRVIMESELGTLQKGLEVLRVERQQLEEEAESLREHQNQLQHALKDKDDTVAHWEQLAGQLEQRLSLVLEHDLPAHQRELAQAKEALEAAQQERARLHQQLEEAQRKHRELQERCEHLNSLAVASSSEATERANQVAKMQQAREELLKRLAGQEENGAHLSKRIAELQQQLEHAQLVKNTMQESFSRDLKAAHSEAIQLRSQLAERTTGSSDLNHRLEKMQASLRAAEKESELLHERLQMKEGLLSTLNREHEATVLEKRALEQELSERVQ